MPDAAVARTPRAGPAEKAQLRDAHVLVVDDDPQIVTLCKHYLETAQHLAPRGLAPRVHTAHGGEEALDVMTGIMADGGWLACALVDVVLPHGIDGFETIRQIWELDPGAQCTLVTGNTDRVEDQIEERLPPHLLDRWDYVAKPFTRFEIVQRVRRSIAIWHGLQQEGKNQQLEAALRDLETAQTQLLQQEKMACIGQLAAGVAHELNNPIGFVHSNLGTLRRYVEKLRTLLAAYDERVDAQDEELLRIRKELKIDFVLQDLPSLVEESEEGTERMRKIVSDLKIFSHPSEKEPEFADVNEGLKSTLNIVHNEIKYKAQVVQDFGDIPPVKCLPGQINQVFMNILINAGQALGEDGGEIRVATRQEGDHVVVAISDTGAGIPADVKSRIFDPFFTTKEVGTGTGLGLSITYDIVRKHGGTISVESEVGQGTTFEIRLPIEGGQADAEG